MSFNDPLMLNLAKMLESRLTRGSVANAAEWAMKYRHIAVTDTNHQSYKKWLAAPDSEKGSISVPKKVQLFDFKHHPWAHEMHVCGDPIVVGQKSAQMGYLKFVSTELFMQMIS